MLTPQSNKIQYEIHILATFCELPPNQRVLKCISKILCFQPALRQWGVIDWDQVSINKELLTGVVPVNKELLTGTDPVKNLSPFFMPPLRNSFEELADG